MTTPRWPRCSASCCAARASSRRSCADGDKALAAFREHKPDLVLLDLMLPGMDGIDVCRQIRAESGVPIVMLTAKTDTVDVVARPRVRRRRLHRQAVQAQGAGRPDPRPAAPHRRARAGAAARSATWSIDVAGHSVQPRRRADHPDPAGVRPAGRAGPQAVAGVHPRGAARAGLGLPARGRHPAGQRARAAAALQDRARPGAPRDRRDRARRRLQGGRRPEPRTRRAQRPRRDRGSPRRPAVRGAPAAPGARGAVARCGGGRCSCASSTTTTVLLDRRHRWSLGQLPARPGSATGCSRPRCRPRWPRRRAAAPTAQEPFDSADRRRRGRRHDTAGPRPACAGCRRGGGPAGRQRRGRCCRGRQSPTPGAARDAVSTGVGRRRRSRTSLRTRGAGHGAPSSGATA